MIMPYLKFFIIFIILFSSSCTSNIQKNGLSITKINEIKVKIGKPSKEDLNNKYGPPLFESIFNKDIVYYASHTSSYLNFNPRKTKQLIVLKITLDKKNIVQNVQKYTEKNAENIDVSNMNTNDQDTRGLFWKQILENMRKTAVQN
jgi:outer membrane protein assembly factor BamE (lipoprotein component of BamABCDE complex)